MPRVVREIRNKFKIRKERESPRLIDFPASGRMVPEIGEKSIREVILGSYRIIYRRRSEAVDVLTVHHGARLLDPKRLRQ